MKDIKSITAGITPFTNKIWLSSPTMHGEELEYMKEAYDTNWISTAGTNIPVVEQLTKELVGRLPVPLSSGTASLHLAIKMAGEKLYGKPKVGCGTLQGHRVFCTDMTFDATVNPVAYEGGEAIFLDTERDTWNTDPKALSRAIEMYPDVKMLVVAHLYGSPGKIDEIVEICREHDIVIVEDAAESMGATYKGVQTGNFGDYSVLSFNGNKIITGSMGGILLVDTEDDARRARKWSTQSRDNAPWYQHSELGYNYRMSNVIAGIIRGQFPHLYEHIGQKRAIYERYKEGLKDLPVTMNPYDAENSEPNFWLSCMIIDKEAMCKQTRTDLTASCVSEPGKSCPTQILEAIDAINAEGRPIWKPMHMQPIYCDHPFVSTADGVDIGADIFERGLCLPSDNKMTPEQQDVIIEVIHRCFE